MTVALRRAWRLTRIAFHLALGVALAEVFYPLVGREVRVAVRARWCREMLNLLGVRLRVSGVVPPGCQLIAANHISWLDVFVIGATLPCWFVSKADMRGWLIIGRLAAANETLFLRRGSPRAAYRMNAEIRARLVSRQSVVIFPEGTTTDGSRVLPFFPALFQPAVDGRHRVLPLAICYRDDAAHRATDVAYINDDPLWKSLRAVIDAPGTEAHLLLDGALDAVGTRRELAARAWNAVAGLQLRIAGSQTLHDVRDEAVSPLPDSA